MFNRPLTSTTATMFGRQNDSAAVGQNQFSFAARVNNLIAQIRRSDNPANVIQGHMDLVNAIVNRYDRPNARLAPNMAFVKTALDLIHQYAPRPTPAMGNTPRYGFGS